MSKTNSFRHILALELNNLRKTISLDKNTYSLGRNSTNSIVIHHRVISRNHATLLKVSYQETEKKNDVFWIIDGDLKGNRSTNGIYINGKKCLSHELKPGDLILFGGIEVKAKYDIVDTSTKTFLSLFKDDSPFNELDTEGADTESLKESNKSTFVELEEEENEPLTEEFIAKINSVQDLLPFPIIEINMEGEITEINAAAEQEFSNIKEINLEHPILKNIKQIFEDNTANLLVRKVIIDHQKFIQYAHCLDENKLIRSYVLDFKKRQQLQLALGEGEKRYHHLVKQISEGIFLVDAVTKKILDANPAYCNLVGYSLDEILDLNIYHLIGIDQDIVQQDLQNIIKEKIPFIRESTHRHKNNSLINVEVNVSLIIYESKEVLCFAVRDIGERKRVEEILRYQASHDLLTGLPNQKLFSEQLSTFLSNAKNSDEILALMFIKLDRFKNINYALGHNIGDQLLQNFAKRMKACLRPIDILARWGGNEFTVLLPEIDNADNVANLSQTILERIKEPFTIENYKLHINVSLGIALYPQHGKDAVNLLKNADAALYYTMQKIGNKYQFFDPKMIDKAVENIQLENLLNLAITKDKLELLYQPQIDVKTGEIIEYEATVRWPDLTLGEIPSEQFLPIAQESGLIVPLNYWMIKTACKQNQIWQENGLPSISIGIKLYPHCLQDQNLLSNIADILAESRLDPNFLDLEIQETNMIQNWASSRTKLRDLLKMGVKISMDDFGSGDSSLNYLRKFPFHKLKIASTFIHNLDQEPENLAIISAIITLALSFNMKVVAKGVGSVEQMELLMNLQCEHMLGKLFSNPLNLEMATHFLSGKQDALTKIINKKTIFDMLSVKKIIR